MVHADAAFAEAVVIRSPLQRGSEDQERAPDLRRQEGPLRRVPLPFAYERLIHGDLDERESERLLVESTRTIRILDPDRDVMQSVHRYRHLGPPNSPSRVSSSTAASL